MTLKYWGGSLIIGFWRLRRVYLLKEIDLCLIRIFTPRYTVKCERLLDKKSDWNYYYLHVKFSLLDPHKSSLLLLMCVLRMCNHCKINIRIIIDTPHNKIVYSIHSSSLLINLIFALALAAAVFLGRCTSLCSFTFGKLSFKLFSLKLLFTFGKTSVLRLVISKGISFWIGLRIILFFPFITHSIEAPRIKLSLPVTKLITRPCLHWFHSV